MPYALSLGGVLAVLWLLLSGHFHEALLVGLGAGSVVACVLIARRMDVIDHEGHPAHLTWRAPFYWSWLLWEIVKSAIDIAKVLVKRDMPIHPTVFDVKATQKSELGHVIYANSITLTPGTITFEVADGVLTVHALTTATREGLATGDMDRRVTAMVGEGGA